MGPGELGGEGNGSVSLTISPDLCLLFYSLCSFWFLPGIVEWVLEGQKFKYLSSHWVATMSCCGHPWPLRGKVCEFFKNHPFAPREPSHYGFLTWLMHFPEGLLQYPKDTPGVPLIGSLCIYTILTPAGNLLGWRIFKTTPSLLLSTASVWPRSIIWILALINYGNVTCFIKTYSYLWAVHLVYS